MILGVALLFSSLLFCSDSTHPFKYPLFLDLVFIWFSNRPMWFGYMHYCAAETIPSGFVSACLAVGVFSVCAYVRACVFEDASLSPAEEAQCVSVEVEGESRSSLYKSGQITEVERPATPFHYPASSALCLLTYKPSEL